MVDVAELIDNDFLRQFELKIDNLVVIPFSVNIVDY